MTIVSAYISDAQAKHGTPALSRDSQKTVSIIIPVPPGVEPTEALSHIRALDYPSDMIEVLVVEGSQPSRQRNAAAANATGEFIYFLDDDSLVTPDALRIGLEQLQDDEIAAVGGPAANYAQASFLQQISFEVLGSWFGSLNMRSRFRAVGSTRAVCGEELILCNMIMRASVFRAMSGLDERLYPNEENELMKRMRQRGHRVIYIPELVVRKFPRRTTAGFVQQMYRYGIGRGRHIFRLFGINDLVFFIPSLFVIYLAVLLIFPDRILSIPLLVYFVFIGIGSISIAAQRKRPSFAFAAFPLFMLMHLSYGLGLLRGVLFPLADDAAPALAVNVIRN
jgi:succinoglycan biosynthesis protein ExoA